MIQTPAELAKILQSTILKDSNIASLKIPESQQLALAIEVPRSQMLNCWHLMRSLVDITQRYPIISGFTFANSGSWYKDLAAENFFSRFYYEEEQQDGHLISVAPESIIDAAKSLNGEEVIKERIKQYDPIADETWRKSDWYLQDLEITERNFAVSPTSKETEAALNSGKIITEIDFERWLFTWEIDNVPKEQLSTVPELTYLQWYDLTAADKIPILLLPISDCWQTLAYIHFFGAINSAEDIAILQYWHDRYGAELVAHYGTILQFYVTNKPQTFMEAYELASEHYVFAPCTLALPGVSIREHARALLHIDRWFLHERP